MISVLVFCDRCMQYFSQMVSGSLIKGINPSCVISLAPGQCMNCPRCHTCHTAKELEVIVQ